MHPWTFPSPRGLSLLTLLALAAGCHGKDGEDTDSGANVCMPPQLDLTTGVAAYVGGEVTDHLGEHIQSGDVDGDGIPDPIISSTAVTVDDNEFVGKVYIGKGGTTGEVDLGTAALATMTGTNEYDYFGEGLRVADFQGDGYAEVMVGARGSDRGDEDGGQAYVFYGPLEGDMKAEDAELKITTQGDDDLTDACPWDDPSAPILDFTQSNLGRGLVNGDFDDNGIMDIAVGLPGTDWLFMYSGPFEAGYQEVLYCLADSLYDDALTTYGHATNDLDELGTSLEVADLDADGMDDLLISAPAYYLDGVRVGKVETLSAPLSYSPDGSIQFSANAGGVVGTSLANRPNGAMASVGDVNGDGFDDVLLGVDYGVTESGSIGGSKEGKAILVYGPLATELTVDQADAIVTGTVAGDKVGASVASAGDVDGDGATDLLIGAPGVDEGGSEAGAAYLYFGPITGGLSADDADVRFDGAAEVRAGGAVAGGGDLNADGFGDIYVSATGNPSEFARGATYLFYGCVR